jgi:tellurium resistance protein TerZ
MAINLVKGQKIDLKKRDGSNLKSFCVGANWGVIEGKNIFGFKKKTAVDLDLSAFIVNQNPEESNIIFHGNLKTSGVIHSGDDRVGDTDGDDGLDNEIISIDLSNLPHGTEQVIFFLNSFENQDFATVPFASIRLYNGTPSRVNEVVATYNIAKEGKFAGYVSMVLGKLYKNKGEWKFSAIGEPTRDRNLKDTVITIANKYI